MSDIILKAENVSKQYRLGVVGTGTLSHDLNRWWHQMRGKEDPYTKVGAVNDRSAKAESEYVWALRDINFEVKRGEVLGIIGKNGAGKSTLLKILSRVTGPTTGSIKTRGRIASLLEVGTGFHPELTGKENIYLNGAILGMTKAEVDEKLDEIVEFSGCKLYVDTPVKRYSSGMRVRLAFAVAAHLEPEILVIDEVLAVGDAEFQKKAIGKMQDISQGEGRTVLFVSHNMASVKSLCTRAIVLENGKVAFEGGTNESVDFYLSQNSFEKKFNYIPESSSYIENVKVDDSEGKDFFVLADTIIFTINLKINKKFFNNNNKLVIALYNDRDVKISNLSTEFKSNLDEVLNPKNLKCIIEKNPIVAGNYYANIVVYVDNTKVEGFNKCLQFTILDGDYFGINKMIGKVGFNYVIDQKWI